MKSINIATELKSSHFINEFCHVPQLADTLTPKADFNICALRGNYPHLKSIIGLSHIQPPTY